MARRRASIPSPVSADNGTAGGTAAGGTAYDDLAQIRIESIDLVPDFEDCEPSPGIDAELAEDAHRRPPPAVPSRALRYRGRAG